MRWLHDPDIRKKVHVEIQPIDIISETLETVMYLVYKYHVDSIKE